MYVKSSLVAIAMALSLPAVAADTYVFDSPHTMPSFELNHMGFSTMRGRFNKTQGQVVIDRAAKTGSIDVTIDTDSIDTGFAKREEHLKGEEFFNVAKYPTMTFKSTALKFDGDNLVGADGTLTLLDVTKPVALTVSNFHCGQNPMNKKDTCGAEVTTSIKRSDFGMTKFLPGVGDNIKIAIEVEAAKQ